MRFHRSRLSGFKKYTPEKHARFDSDVFSFHIATDCKSTLNNFGLLPVSLLILLP